MSEIERLPLEEVNEEVKTIMRFRHSCNHVIWNSNKKR